MLARREKYGANLFVAGEGKKYWHCVWVAAQDFCIKILILACVLMFFCAFISKNREEVLA